MESKTSPEEENAVAVATATGKVYVSDFNQRRRPLPKPTPATQPNPYVFVRTGNYYKDLIGQEREYQSTVQGGIEKNKIFDSNPEFKQIFMEMMQKAKYAAPFLESSDAITTLYASFTTTIQRVKRKGMSDEDFASQVREFIRDADNSDRYKKPYNVNVRSFYFVLKLNDLGGKK